MYSTETKRSRTLRILALICFLGALALIVLFRLFSSEHFLQWHSKYYETLTRYQEWVRGYGDSPLVFAIILFNYIIKAVIPWFPLPFMMFLSGMIFESKIAVPLNIIGCMLLFTIKFVWGKKWGGGNAEKILMHYDKAHLFIGEGNIGSKMTLFFLRAFPFIPVNSVSQLYGTTIIPFWQYLIISLLGFSYKIYSYTMIGRNLFNPFSYSFLNPIIFLLLITGLMLLTINTLISATSPLIKKLQQRKDSKNNE